MDNVLQHTAERQDLTTWTGGPLPQDLEQIAFKIFLREYPERLWYDELMRVQRDDARRFALQLRVDFIKLDRWTLSNMVDKLDEGFTRLVCGDRAPSAGEVKQLRDYAESCIEDLFRLFGGDAMATRLSESWQHTPEDEPDDSEIEDLKGVN